MVIIQEEKNFIITGIFFGLITNIDIGWILANIHVKWNHCKQWQHYVVCSVTAINFNTKFINQCKRDIFFFLLTLGFIFVL